MRLLNTTTFQLHDVVQESYAAYLNFCDYQTSTKSSGFDEFLAGKSQVEESLGVHHARERRYLPLTIKGRERYALPDTGLVGNAIAEDFALSIGAVIEPGRSKHTFVNAKNHSFQSVGTTKLVVSLPEGGSSNPSVRKWTCSFDVVKQLPAPLVLGNKFLKMTEALTSLAHRLVRKSMSVYGHHSLGPRKFWRFMHMEMPRQKLGCFLDAEQAFAAVDSGSDIDVVSLDYVNQREWQIHPLSEDECYVMLANNELVKLAGHVETTLGIQGGCMSKKLYVLDGLMCDVVLGDPTIEMLDLFNNFKDSLIDVDGVEDTAFHMIQWVEKMEQISLEVEQILAGQAEKESTGGLEKKGWKSLFGTKFPKKNDAADKDAILNELLRVREEFEGCLANWRRAAEIELSKVTGDELANQKAEIERRKERNKEVRDKILLHILLFHKPTTGSDDQPAQQT